MKTSERKSAIYLPLSLPSLRALNTHLLGGLGATHLVQATMLAFQYTSLLFLMVPIVTPSTVWFHLLAHLQNQDEHDCVICFENEVIAALVPCGHNSSAWNVPTRSVKRTTSCPVCQTAVTQAIQITLTKCIYIYINTSYLYSGLRKGMGIMVPPVNFPNEFFMTVIRLYWIRLKLLVNL